ncbi:MAG: signal peptidase II [Eubacteriaceae bacterium]|nr:signal peptidase II [Eubacteriaceae bacterium]
MLYISIIILSIILDRITKALAVKHLMPIDTFPLWKDVFHLTYCENTGAAFSMFSDSTAALTVFSIIIALFLCMFLIKQIKKNHKKILYLSGITMMIGGALGNIIDRILYGYVVDFFDFTLINFAIFNVADCFICVGAAIFCLYLVFDKEIQL